MDGSIDIFTISLSLLGGLALFLFGVAMLSNTLRDVVGDAMRQFLARLTTNPLAGLATGTVVTMILGSSSLTIILVIALVHAGALTFRQSLGVVLGSNIGTTASSQIFAAGVDRYAPLLLAVGLVMWFLLKGERIKGWGKTIFSAGLALYGLHRMGAAMRPLRESEQLTAWLANLEDPLSGMLAGAGLTALIQSSSAMMGINIKLAAAGLMTLPAGVAAMLGAEIGTCLDTLLASIGRTRQALRTGVFHFAFNVATVMIGLVLRNQLAAAALWFPHGGDTARQIANAHVIFNVVGAFLFLPFVPYWSRLLHWAIPPARGSRRRPDSPSREEPRQERQAAADDRRATP